MKIKAPKFTIAFMAMFLITIAANAVDCIVTYNYSVNAAYNTFSVQASICNGFPTEGSLMCHYENYLDWGLNMDNALNAYNICCASEPGCQ